jgi:hypothetical protein
VVIDRRGLQKIRGQEQGHAYVEAQLTAYGATPMQPGEDPRAWLRAAKPAVRAVSRTHPGYHRYAIRTATKRNRPVLIAGPPRRYPKKDAAQQLELAL